MTKEDATKELRDIHSILTVAPTRIPDFQGTICMAGDCGSCPSCACIEAGVQFLAVIEAPATVPIMVTVVGIRLAS